MIIEGVNVWDHAWASEGSAFVNVPGERRVETAERYAISTGSRVIPFIATEFSNGVWGFFAAADE